MKRLMNCVFATGLALALAAGPCSEVSASPDARSVEIRLKDGSRWRGEVGQNVDVTYLQQRIEVQVTGTLTKVADLYIVVEANVAGEIRKRTIFRGDIVAMRDSDAAPSGAVRERRGARESAPGSKKSADHEGKRLGVFVLPLEGFVGTSIRREEIVKIGEKADEYGPGQIIVLLINTDGGSAVESQFIAEEIFKLRERHRVIAWVQKAISAGCQAAMCCQEIYFMTEGSAGAVTTWNPGTGQSIKGEELERSMEHLAAIAKRSGYSEHIAHAMKTNKAMCSYDKDPKTGEVTFYGDLSGEYVLSDENSNLSFTSQTAVHCGFAKGIADTEEELAALLDLPEWSEVDDYGRKISKDWQDLVKKAEEEIPRLIKRLEYQGSAGDAKERLGVQIRIFEKFLRWWDRCPNVAQMRLPEKETLERQLAELRKQLADIRRAERRRGGG